MTVTYTGGAGELTAAQQTKLESRLTKLGRMIDKKGEKDARVILVEEKRSKKAEVTLNYLHHSFVANAKGPAYLPAVMEALDKLEKQIGKVADKIRGQRNSEKPSVAVAAVEAKPAPRDMGPQLMPAKVSKKPMNVEESVLVAIRKKVNYVAFRDADTGGISVVIQRPDGNFDLVRT